VGHDIQLESLPFHHKWSWALVSGKEHLLAKSHQIGRPSFAWPPGIPREVLRFPAKSPTVGFKLAKP